MLKKFNFTFSGEFQNFHIEAKISDYDLIYKVYQADGVDGVNVSQEWQIYSGDAVLWLKAFIELKIFNWEDSYSVDSNSKDSASVLLKWTLDIEEDYESALPEKHITGLNAYPDNFPDFLELIRVLLGLKFLILEV